MAQTGDASPRCGRHGDLKASRESMGPDRGEADQAVAAVDTRLIETSSDNIYSNFKSSRHRSVGPSAESQQVEKLEPRDPAALESDLRKLHKKLRKYEQQWMAKDAEVKEKELALEELHLKLQRTVEDSKAELENRDRYLNSLQEIVEAQAEKIREAEAQRGKLEFEARDLRLELEDITEELQRKISKMEDQLLQSEEALLKSSAEQKDAVIADLRKQLADKTNDYNRMQQELKTLDTFAVMRQRLDSLLGEVTSCHRQMDTLTQGIVDRDQEIKEKNQILRKLTKEINDTTATNAELQRKLDHKVHEHQALRENFRRTEEKLCGIANQVLTGEAILGHIVDKVMPNSKTQLGTDSWESLPDEILQAVDNLVDAASRTDSLERELNGLRRLLEKLSPESEASEIMSENTESLEISEVARGASRGHPDKTRADMARTLETLRIVESEKLLLQRESQEILAGHLTEISSLRKSLAECEAALSACREENEKLKALVDRDLVPPTGTAETPNQVEELLSKLENLEKEKALLRTDLADVQKQLEQARVEIQNKTSEIEGMTRTSSRRQNDLTLFEEKLQELRARFESKLHALSDELTNSDMEKKSLAAKVSTLEKQIEDSEATLIMFRNAVDRLEKELALKSGELEGLMKRLEVSNYRKTGISAQLRTFFRKIRPTK
ncbi:myosin-2 heavy chain-like [Galendromus occidentalis]|uniref:Myosin-2 heavy chain-like n=1 Tax=Galendromus occidentalis TaxID=34638 RepID=A0AAJ6VYY7_9ACAR|nr:myosin-2 heavy chain-like [Galendromus occidentalis]